MTAEQIVRTRTSRWPRRKAACCSRHILVPGTITPDTDRIARVPSASSARCPRCASASATTCGRGDVVAVLDSREVADAKSEESTSPPGPVRPPEGLNFERQQRLLASAAASKAAFDNAKAVFQENQLRVDLARQKLSALGLNAAEVAARAETRRGDAQRLDPAPVRAAGSHLRPHRRAQGRRGHRRRHGGRPADVYTVADLSTVWIELAGADLGPRRGREGARVTVNRGGRSVQGKVVFVSRC